MSISLLLVPLAIAAVSAWEVSRGEQPGTGVQVCRVTTRMKDIAILRQALADTGAVVHGDDQGLAARWNDVEARFTRDTDGIWSAHFSGRIDEGRAVELVQAVDRAYGRGVQAAVVEKLKQRSTSAGMRLESETRAEDQSVTLVLALVREGTA